jgi:hypothetical protein
VERVGDLCIMNSKYVEGSDNALILGTGGAEKDHEKLQSP